MRGQLIDPTSKHSGSYNWKNGGLYMRYFEGIGLLKLKDFERAIGIAFQGEGREEDVVKLFILEMLGLIFFPNTGGTVAPSMIKFIESFETMNSISWPCSIHKNLMDKIRRYNEAPLKVSGCVVQLLYWICEHADITKPAKGREAIFPRAGKWNLSQVACALEARLHELRADEVSEQMLVPLTKTELELINKDKTVVDTSIEDGGMNEGSCSKVSDLELDSYLQAKDNEIQELKKKLNELEEEKHTMKQDYERLLSNMRREIEKLSNQRYAPEETREANCERQLGTTAENVGGEREELKENEVLSTYVRLRLRKRGQQNNAAVPEPEKKKSKVQDNKEMRKAGKKGDNKVEKTAGKNKEEGKPIKIGKGYKLKDVTKTQLWGRVKEEEKGVLKSFFQNAARGTVAWKKGTGELRIERVRLEDLMLNRMISYEIIDWYAHKLVEGGLKFTTLFLPSTLWTCIRANFRSGGKTLQGMVKEIKEQTQFLMLPLNTPKTEESCAGHHWTLLHCDLTSQKWTHYNSLRPRTEEGIDRSLNDAKKMVCSRTVIQFTV